MDNKNNDNEHFNDLAGFLENENKQMFKKTRWQSFRYNKPWLKMKRLKWPVMPEYVFLRESFKNIHAIAIRSERWLNSRHQEKRDAVMVLLITTSLYIYQILNTSL